MTGRERASGAPVAGGAPLRVGLVGFGLAGSAFHAPLVDALPGLALTSIVTSSAERAALAAERYPGARVLADADALWAAAPEHDLAVIAAPNRFHVPLALAAVEAGLHAVVDKPVAASAADARRLADAAVEHRRVVAAFHNRRWDGDALTLRRLRDERALGRVQRFESRFERWQPERRAGAWRELPAPEDAGGVLFDLGTHLIDQALWLFGRPARVYAELDRRRPGVEVDDDAFVSLEHAGGVRSQLWASLAAAQPGPRMRVLGSRSAYVKWGLDVQEAALRAGETPDAPGFGAEPRERWGLLGVEGAAEPVATERGNYLGFYAGVESSIRTGAAPPVPLADAVAVLEVIEAARASAWSGAGVPL